MTQTLLSPTATASGPAPSPVSSSRDSTGCEPGLTFTETRRLSAQGRRQRSRRPGSRRRSRSSAGRGGSWTPTWRLRTSISATLLRRCVRADRRSPRGSPHRPPRRRPLEAGLRCRSVLETGFGRRAGATATRPIQLTVGFLSETQAWPGVDRDVVGATRANRRPSVVAHAVVPLDRTVAAIHDPRRVARQAPSGPGSSPSAVVTTWAPVAGRVATLFGGDVGNGTAAALLHSPRVGKNRQTRDDEGCDGERRRDATRPEARREDAASAPRRGGMASAQAPGRAVRRDRGSDGASSAGSCRRIAC